MTLLAIDTAGPYASVALFDARGLRAEGTWHAQRHHDDQLFPSIERQLALAGVRVTDLTRVAVAIGPGSFTGLRVAIAAAQGIARASRAAAVPVTTCDAARAAFEAEQRQVGVLIPAGRNEHYVAVYPPGVSRAEIGIVALGDLPSVVDGEALFTGEIDDRTAGEIGRVLGPSAHVAPAPARIRRAGVLAALAWQRAEEGATIPAEELEPLYIRAPLIREVASSLRQG